MVPVAEILVIPVGVQVELPEPPKNPATHELPDVPVSVMVL
jgi:hypothetical protein